MTASKKRHRRVFVVGAFVPNGGTFMAYHVGQIVQQEFGFEFVSVNVGHETAEQSFFRYELSPKSITITEMESSIEADDILVCNPSFSSNMFGIRIPGVKICYVQGFNTFSVLDCRFDLYVSVSAVVADLLSSIYRIDRRIIPAFVDVSAVPEPEAWGQRPEGSTIFYMKGSDDYTRPILGRLRSLLSVRAPDIEIGDNLASHALPHSELLARIGRHRHLLTLSIAEGFGLVPLEAMAMGTTVVGFDGFGGRDYMRDGINCSVASYPDIEAVADKLIAITRSPEMAAQLAAEGRDTATQYTYARFRDAWTQELSGLLKDRRNIERSSSAVRSSAPSMRTVDTGFRAAP